MKVVVQRVSEASVRVEGQIVGKIQTGIVVLVGFNQADSADLIPWMVDKICHLRIFSDQNDKMNYSLLDVAGEMLIISQFTLYGDCKRGRRPSYSDAARPEIAEALYEEFISQVKSKGVNTSQGIFGANMQVQLINDGPVTLILDHN